MSNTDIRHAVIQDKKAKEAFLVNLLLEHNPILGTQIGLSGKHDGSLPPTEKDVRNQRMVEIQEALSNLNKAKDSYLPKRHQIDIELANCGIEGMKIFESALLPLERDPNWYLDNVMIGLYSLLIRVDIPIDEKAEYIYSRMQTVTPHLQAGKNQIKRPSRILVENAIENAKGGIDFCENSLGEFIENIPDKANQKRLKKAQEDCLKAIQKFLNYVEELQKDSVEDFAIGKSAFNALLKETHLIPYNSDELLELGYEITAKIEKELENLSLDISRHKKWWTTAETLTAYHPQKENLINDYVEMLNDAKGFVEEQGLVDLTNCGLLDVQLTPSFARANLPFAAYVSVPPFAQSGRAKFWVTPPADGLSDEQTNKTLEQHHLGRILVACVHEGYPGHHVQFSDAQKFRSPLRHIFTSTFFIEGWALYCEELMRQAGFKSNHPQYPLLQISQLRDQLWRALRIILDVGLHCNGMSQNDATKLLVDKHVLDSDSAAAEVMYYCSAPTQPMSYMVGKLLVEELIDKCKSEKTERFKSLRDIHTQILSHASLPFPLLEHSLEI